MANFDFLPLFPLSLVVFPGESFRLHIFEERYKQLVGECVSAGKTFGVPTVIDQKLGNIGTEVRIVSVDKSYGGGELDISTEGVRRFEMLNFYREAPGKLYSGAEIAWFLDDPSFDMEIRYEIFELLEALNESLGIQRKVAEKPEEIDSFLLGHQIGLTLKQEYELLALKTEQDRLVYIRKYIEDILPVVEQTQRMKARAKLNGHYKNIVPPNF